jgi:3-oxoacyl-[acyl-carrier protein] reductase
MDLELEGMKAIVTGGSSGIGYACAAALRAEGVEILLAALPEGLEKAAEAIRSLASGGSQAEVIAVPCDLRQADSAQTLVRTALERLGSRRSRPGRRLPEPTG